MSRSAGEQRLALLLITLMAVLLIWGGVEQYHENERTRRLVTNCKEQ